MDSHAADASPYPLLSARRLIDGDAYRSIRIDAATTNDAWAVEAIEPVLSPASCDCCKLAPRPGLALPCAQAFIRFNPPVSVPHRLVASV